MKKSFTLVGVIALAAVIGFTMLGCGGDSGTSVTLDRTTITMDVGDSEEIVATTNPANARLQWTSDNEAVATVDGGWVSGVSKGTATITAKAADGGKATCRVTVTMTLNSIKVEGDTLVHKNPLIEKGLNFAGTISEEDYTIDFSAGAFQYKWPTGDNFDINDYAYCIVELSLIDYTPAAGTNAGSGSGVQLKQYGNDTDYGGFVGNDRYPWLSQTSSIRFLLSGAGTTGGLSMRYSGVAAADGGHIEVRITNITFYKLDTHTVSFALNGGNGSFPDKTVYHDETLGSNFPTAVPTKTDYTFIGWKNEEGATVTATTPITGDWTLTAQWILTSLATPVHEEAPADGTLFSAVGSYAAGTPGETFTYGGKEYWIVANAQSGSYAWTAPIAPFNSAEATFDEIKTAQSSYGNPDPGYTRIAFKVSDMQGWGDYLKVTITYDLVSVGGNGTGVLLRNSPTAAGGSDVTTPAFAVGTDRTVTVDASLFASGNIGIVKSQSGALLLRITKVTLHYF